MKTIIGQSVENNEMVCLDSEARARGTYIIGATGTGKTTLLQSIAYQDMLAGHGVCVLDPHGDMIDWLLAHVPEERENDVIVFNPAEQERPFGLNILECDRDDPQQVRLTVDTIMTTLRRLFDWTWGPHLEHVLSHTLWTAMANRDSTLIDVLLLLTDKDYRQEQVDMLDERTLLNFWKTFPTKSQQQQLDFISSTVNKLTPFLLDETMRNMVGQGTSTFKMKDIMNDKKILLVNLSKGELGQNNSALLGSVLINLILIAALGRRAISPDERKEKVFHVIVDEYQNFASESFSILQSEARKYAVNLTVAHQFRDQLPLELRGSALNVGNFICFRTIGIDSQELASQFDNTPPDPDPIWIPKRARSQRNQDEWKRGNVDIQVEGQRRLYSDVMMEKANVLTNLPPFHFLARIIEPKSEDSRKLTLAEYTLQTIDPETDDQNLIETVYGELNQERAQQIQQNSYELGTPKPEVVASIEARTIAHMSTPPRRKVVDIVYEDD